MIPTLPRLTKKGKQSAPYKYAPTITTETYTSPCTSRFVDPEQLDKELKERYGDRLEPVKGSRIELQAARDRRRDIPY